MITRGIKKSSKRRQKLYVKFLKNRNSKNELEYRDYKKLFESIKKRAKNNYFLEKRHVITKKVYSKNDLLGEETIAKNYCYWAKTC